MKILTSRCEEVAYIIEKCSDCPVFYTENMYQYCYLKNRSIEYEETIPTWCPLEDIY